MHSSESLIMPVGIGLVGGGKNGLLLDIEIVANKMR